MAKLPEGIIRDPKGIRCRLREVPPKPGKLPPFLHVLVFESEQGRFWTSIPSDTLLRYALRDLFDMLKYAKQIPVGRVISEHVEEKRPSHEDDWPPAAPVDERSLQADPTCRGLVDFRALPPRRFRNSQAQRDCQCHRSSGSPKGSSSRST